MRRVDRLVRQMFNTEKILEPLDFYSCNKPSKVTMRIKPVHKISFIKMSEGRKICTMRLANQQREEFSYRWAAVTCKHCLAFKPERKKKR